MLKAIQARGYRSLKHIDLRFEGNFYVLAGPNGSGKSTLLDAIALLTDYMTMGLEGAVGKRTRNFQDLVWGRPAKSPGFELAVEFEVGDKEMRYELRIEETVDGVRAVVENGYLGRLTPEEFVKSAGSDSVVQMSDLSQRQIFGTAREQNQNYFWLRSENVGRQRLRFPRNPGNDRSAIGLLSIMPESFPLRDNREEMDFSNPKRIVDTLIGRGVQCLQLDSRKLRQASKPNGDDGSRLADDGGNLPRVLEKLKANPVEWERWLDYVRLVLPKLEEIKIVHREDDRHAYLMVRHAGVEVPSWGVSEGTLRLLALTVIAYLRAPPLAYLLEEPENGIHPMAIEYAYHALSAVHDAQVFIASHSPTLLRCVDSDQILCIGHDSKQGTVIIHGDEHPRLQGWRVSTDDTVFWAADILS